MLRLLYLVLLRALWGGLLDVVWEVLMSVLRRVLIDVIPDINTASKQVFRHLVTFYRQRLERKLDSKNVIWTTLEISLQERASFRCAYSIHTRVIHLPLRSHSAICESLDVNLARNGLPHGAPVKPPSQSHHIPTDMRDNDFNTTDPGSQFPMSSLNNCGRIKFSFRNSRFNKDLWSELWKNISFLSQ